MDYQAFDDVPYLRKRREACEAAYQRRERGIDKGAKRREAGDTSYTDGSTAQGLLGSKNQKWWASSDKALFLNPFPS